jgi:hypothetical protein
MHMAWHYDPGVQRIILASTLPNYASDNRGDAGHAEIKRTTRLTIELPVHANEGFPRRKGLGEILSSRQTAMQPEGNEQWMADSVKVRQMAASDEHFSPN